MEALEVKPRFRFAGRRRGRYVWEPLNEEARALMMTPSAVTSVAWFWGDRLGLQVEAEAVIRAEALGMTPAEYREHVQRLREDARALQSVMVPVTAEEMAELIPPGSWPAGMTRLAADVFPDGRTPSAGGLLPSPVPATSAVKLSSGCYYVPASAVRRYGRRVLDALNQTGARP